MASKKASEVLSRLKTVTNINNNNNYNNNNNLITSIIVPLQESNEGKDMTSSSSGLASLSASQKPLEPPLGGIGTLPPKWNGLKLDLFCNGVNIHQKENLKLRLSITNHNAELIQLDAALNSPIRYIFRGLREQSEEKHIMAIRSYYSNLKKRKIDFRCSKFALPGKEGSISNIACFLFKATDAWAVTIIKDGIMYEYDLEDEGSPVFRKNNGIATAFYGRNKNKAKWLTTDDLGI